MNRIVLASASPRRKKLLLKYGLNPIIKSSNIKEVISRDETPKQVAMSLAFSKAKDVARKLNGDRIVIAADTLVYFDGDILGKPADRNEARYMLEKMSGKKHFVITGISIVGLNSNKKIIDYEETEVKFRNLTHSMIENYLDTKEYKDKAGSYGIQDKGEILVERIKGCYPNVIGLPIPKLDKLLKKHFSISLL